MTRLIPILTLCIALITTAANAGNMGIHGDNTTSLPNSGKVIEVINVAGYTYLHIEDKDRKEWIAGNANEIKKGDTVRYSKGSVMRDFFSKALNRTFPEILFTSAIQIEKAAAAANVVEASSGQQASVIEGRVLSTTDSGGYTYVEAEQSDKTVVWLAAPKTALKKGDAIRYANDGAVMKNFSSKTLNRTFAEILFVGEVQVIK